MLRRLFAKYSLLIVLLSFALSVAEARAEQSDTEHPSGSLDALYDMSIEELMEIPIATAASRLPQTSGELSSPVTIITAEDIHRSGLTGIPEILRFACGVDVLETDRRRHAIGIHGLHETFSDRTTLLINGRLADNPVYGGPDFQGLPLMIEDIDRIEIVRSPGSASWGANALTGVINIVTKKPVDILGGMARTTLTEFGDSYTQIRWADKHDDWSWRISVGYEDVKSSEDAIDGTADYTSFAPALNALIGFNTYEARDFTRNQRIDTEVYHDISDETKLSLGIGQTHIDAGGFELGGYYPGDDIREDHLRSYAKLDHHFDNGNSGHLQWFGKFWNANWPMAGQFVSRQYELEGQYNFDPKDQHQTSIGTSFRWDHFNSDVGTGHIQQARFRSEPIDEYNAGLFMIDRWNMSNRWTLESQIRGDYYSGTRTDWSGRLTSLYAMDHEKKHTLRFAVAKAFRAPLVAIRKASTNSIPIGGGLFLINVTAPKSLENEETFCLETGYTAKLSKTLSLRTDLFYQKFHKLIGYRQTTNIFNQIFATADNINGAEAWGGDIEMALSSEWGKISSWYSYNAFTPDRPDQDLLAFLPAKHKMGMRYQRDLLPGWTFNANYSFYDVMQGNPVTGNNDIDASSRMDLTLSKRFNNEHGEIMFGLRDVFDKIHEPVREATQYTGHEVPGRTFFVSLLLKY